ncbi:regulatory protein LuxR [Streptomyces sp. ACT-1]|nr:regulatory protein LuxR [Streptomyces sp. ACT-1]
MTTASHPAHPSKPNRERHQLSLKTLTPDEQSIIQHLAAGVLARDLPAALGLPKRTTQDLTLGLHKLLPAARNHASLVAICYTTALVAPPPLLDPSDIFLPADERELLVLIAMGMNGRDIAKHLGRAASTVGEQITSLLGDLQVKTWAQAVHIGWQFQIVTAAVIRTWLEHAKDVNAATAVLPAASAGPLLHVRTREGEVPDTPRALCAVGGPFSAEARGLSYWDQTADDRDENGVLWARVSEVLSRSGRPVGRPLQGVHPARQRDTMRNQRCRVGYCTARLGPTRGGSGGAYLYLVTAQEQGAGGVYRTVEPPVCIEHALLCADSEPRLRDGYTALLVTSSAISGVLGRRYTPVDDGVTVAASRDNMAFHSYTDHSGLRWVLASQLVRDLTSYEVVDLRLLVREACNPSAEESASCS